LLNTGGTLIANKKFLKKGEPIMVVHADNLSFCDFGQFIDSHYHRPEGVEITMMTFNTDSPESCGIVNINKQDIVVSFYEKLKLPISNLANGAVYIMEPSVIEMMIKLNKQKVDISLDVLPNYMNRIKIFMNDIYHRDIGDLDSYGLAQVEYYNFTYNSLKSKNINKTII
jgi:mannose-1-phosphate guanylyltransferase